MNLVNFLSPSESVCVSILMGWDWRKQEDAGGGPASADVPSVWLLRHECYVTVMSSRHFWHCAVSRASVDRAQVCMQSLRGLLRAASFVPYGTVPSCNAEVQGYRTAYESACFASQSRVCVNGSFMFLHNVLHCSTHGICCLRIGGLIVMTVGQIVLSAYKESYCSHLVK